MEIDKQIGRAFLALLAQFLSGASSTWRDSLPDKCQRIYFANHTSHLDVLVVWSSLPPYVRKLTRPVAAKDYWNGTPLRRYISTRLFNAILMDRQDVKVHHSPIDLMLNEMEDKYSIIIFPEGGRQTGGEIADFKSGLYYMCKRRPELELIPIYLDNMNRILPRGTYLPVPMLSRVVFGRPMWLEINEKKADFLSRARQAIIDLRDK
ncbi:MAG: lysophospholipid acyltransferase family protein [Planctomycetia bacterium]|nr:lysophospholipid acyltransferase family protein [Planctomycetia bacterium]